MHLATFQIFGFNYISVTRYDVGPRLNQTVKTLVVGQFQNVSVTNASAKTLPNLTIATIK